MPEKIIIGNAELWHGDALEILPAIGKIDAVITDPPYSSGGQFRGDRTQKTSIKYVQTDSLCTFREEFSGDNRDQRAFLAWSTMWLSSLHHKAVDGGVAMIFIDWRQLPTLTDAVQCGGWVWRNIITWWKPGVRMQRGRFSSSSEFLVYASRGVPEVGEKSPQNVLQFAPVSGEDKRHIAEKPLALLTTLVSVTKLGAIICDPFMGSGTTGVAAIQQGRRFIGIEMDSRHFDTACRRIEHANDQGQLFAPETAPPPVQERMALEVCH